MQNPKTSRHMIGIVGAAQVDPYGNLNSTVIGQYTHPKVRFPGSGGACDIASFIGRTIIFMQHDKRKLVPKLDYLTSPGWIDGPQGRKQAGLGPDGPTCVITDMAVMGFDQITKKMYLEGCYEGVSCQDVLDHMNFTIDISRAEDIQPPLPQELSILRDRCDPKSLIL
jgi:glutaconate CoA-transferase subunit B